MDIDFVEYADAGTPSFSSDANGYYIQRESGERGRWFGVWPDRVAVGDEIPIKVETAGLGSVTVTFWQDRIGAGALAGSQDFGSGSVDGMITVTAGNIVRIELRGWRDIPAGETSIDSFTEIQIGLPLEPPTLPAPALSEINNPDGDGEYIISWTAVDGAELYRLQEQINGGGWTTIYYSAETETTITGRRQNEYCYRVDAMAGEIESEYSNVVCTIVTESGGGLDAPTLYEINNPENGGEFSIIWDAVTGADGYQLEENMNERAWVPVEEYDGSAVGFDRAWVPVGSFCYRVRAVAGWDAESEEWAEISAWSNVECTSHYTDQMFHVYHLAEPDLTHEWIVTIGDNGSFSAKRQAMPSADIQEYIDRLAATDPGDAE